jgi:hypothetical protein
MSIQGRSCRYAKTAGSAPSIHEVLNRRTLGKLGVSSEWKDLLKKLKRAETIRGIFGVTLGDVELSFLGCFGGLRGAGPQSSDHQHHHIGKLTCERPPSQKELYINPK